MWSFRFILHWFHGFSFYESGLSTFGERTIRSWIICKYCPLQNYLKTYFHSLWHMPSLTYFPKIVFKTALQNFDRTTYKTKFRSCNLDLNENSQETVNRSFREVRKWLRNPFITFLVWAYKQVWVRELVCEQE